MIQDNSREVYDKKFGPLVWDTCYRFSEGSDFDNKDDHSYRQLLFEIWDPQKWQYKNLIVMHCYLVNSPEQYDSYGIF